MEPFSLIWYLLGVLTPLVVIIIFGFVMYARNVRSDRVWMNRIENILEAQDDEETLEEFRNAGET